MAQKMTVTGTPTTGLKLVKELMGKDPHAMKVYAFTMQEGGNTPSPKPLPAGSRIEFTVLVTEKQLKKAGVENTPFTSHKYLVQGEISIDVPFTICTGDMALIASTIGVIPQKEERKEKADQDGQAVPEKQETSKVSGKPPTEEDKKQKKALSVEEKPQRDQGATHPMQAAQSPWYKAEDVVQVKVSDILLTEPIHYQAKNITLPKQLRCYVERPEEKLQPVVVRRQGEKYSLVTGMQRYFLAKVLGLEQVPAVLTDLSHEAFMQAHGWGERSTPARGKK